MYKALSKPSIFQSALKQKWWRREQKFFERAFSNSNDFFYLEKISFQWERSWKFVVFERNFRMQLGICLYISFSISKIKKTWFFKYRNVLGGVWVMEIIKIGFFLVFLVFLYRKSIIFPVFLQEIQTPGNVPLYL